MNLTVQRKLKLIEDLYRARQVLDAKAFEAKAEAKAAEEAAKKAQEAYNELLLRLMGGTKVKSHKTEAATTKTSNGKPDEYANRVAAVYSELAAATAPATIRELVGPKTGDFYQVRKALAVLKKTKKARCVQVGSRAKWEVTK